MADDEDYWNSTSVAKPFDFDEIDDASSRGDNVLRLFGVANRAAAQKQPPDSGPVEDIRSNTSNSDDTRSVRSDFGDEEISSRPSVLSKSPVTRSSSVLNSGNSGTVETVASAAILAISASASSIGSAGKSINQAITNTLKSTPSSSPSLAEPASRVRRESSSSSHSQLSAEVQYLKRNLEVSRKDQWLKVSPKDMVWRIIRNKPYSLENYRSMEEKIALLDHALNLHDTTAILIAVLHMKNTLSGALFFDEMSKKPDAVDQYVTFLKDDGRFQECIEILEVLGRADEVATLQLEIALQSDQITDQLKALDLAMKRQPLPLPSRPSDLPHLKKFKSLLEIQRPIEELDEKAAKDPKNELFTAHPRRSILGISLMQTLFYCCMYHFDKPETSFCSPLFLRKTFAISEKQFLWTAVNALSKVQKWTEIQALLMDKTGWFGQPKPKAVIGFDKVVDILCRNATPPDVLAYYLRLIDDPELRLQYSIKCRCHSVAIDTFAALKEFDKLQEYSAKFDPESDEYRYCQQILQRITAR